MKSTRSFLLFAGLSLLCGCGSGPSDGPVASPPAPVPSGSPGGSPPSPVALVPAPEGTGIHVFSEPSGASIFLNGRLMGATPLALPAMAPGTYSLRLERHGCAPHQQPLMVNGAARVIRAQLSPEPTGTLEVDVKPPGAEVLLDGRLIGLTPLRLDDVPAGVHEMTVRKTNFRPYTAVVRVQPGQAARFADGDRPLLKDLILEMLNSLIQSEPQRASHLLDKGHYLFINNRMDEAALAFLRAEEVVSVQPVFPDDMPLEERAAELRLFAEDRKRVSREVARHRRPYSIDYAMVRDFNVAYEKAKRNRLLENVGSWEWVSARGRGLIAEAQYLQAVQLYETHLERVGDGESAVPCALELVKVRLLLRDMSGFRIVFERISALAADNPRQLLAVVQAVLPYKDRLRTTQRSELLNILAAPLHRLAEKADPPLKGECSSVLGGMLMLQGRAAEAVPFLIQSVETAATETEKEERSLQVAEALRLAGRSAESKEWYSRLSESPRESIRNRARAGLILLGVTKR